MTIPKPIVKSRIFPPTAEPRATSYSIFLTAAITKINSGSMVMNPKITEPVNPDPNFFSRISDPFARNSDETPSIISRNNAQRLTKRSDIIFFLHS